MVIVALEVVVDKVAETCNVAMLDDQLVAGSDHVHLVSLLYRLCSTSELADWCGCTLGGFDPQLERSPLDPIFCELFRKPPCPALIVTGMAS